jgi:hypothetical protein
MKIELIFERTAYDPTTMWTEIKKVTVDVPDYLVNSESQYHLTGMVAQDAEGAEG